ncbi:hypothetical protein DM2_1344 [Halorubrum sp. DM2]|uniref:hypothetical protein n=1 Tax=Halorubrum sp. DM2 TaxID=2527867 RepID=UPI0024B6C38A|nr:hypothetical protein [Halorubrum sp. DM2]VTT88010.1 hypothetical protein DM2_1344 [Halorubrum sp. DM2]
MTERDRTAAENRESVATDGGTATRQTPETAATEHPTVLDVDVVGDRALATVERGDVSIVVEAPAGISAEELEETLSGVPESIAKTTERFAAPGCLDDEATETNESATGGDGA